MNKDTPLDEALYQAAVTVMQNSHSPYSHFKVGCALRTKNQEIFMGTNVENASYGGTICAERVAIFNAVSKGQKEIQELLIITDTDEPASPCGFCRQVMSEFMDPEAIITTSNLQKKFRKFLLSELLPYSFTKKDLD